MISQVQKPGTWQRMLAVSSRLAGLLPIALTLMPLWRTGRGWIRIWDFPRPQIVGLGVLGQALLWKRDCRQPGDEPLGFLLWAALVYQAMKILPYTPMYPVQVLTAGTHRPERRVRLLILNVLQSNRRADLTLRAVKEADADLVCLVETDAWWESRMREMEQDYPWFQKCPLSNTYGMLLYSRLRLEEVRTRFVVRPEIPSMRATVTLRSGDRFVLYTVHPRPPLPDSPTYGRDAELVLLGREIDRERLPAIVMGDLNDVAWSYTTDLFQQVSHTLDPRIGRGMFNTFHARYPFARYPLDHVFHTRDFQLVGMRRLGYTGSDHFPVVVELAYLPSRKEGMERPELTRAGEEQVQDILEDARDRDLI